MPISQGVFKQTRIARQTAKGTLALTNIGQVLRRETSTHELQKETYTTESEINSAQQLASNRHGVKLVNGRITGILSPGTYADPLSAILRRDFAAVAAITGASITIAGTGPTYTVTRAAGDFLAGGIKIGMVARLTAGAFNVANSNKNLLVTNVTATVLTVMVLNNTALVAEGPIASATVSVPGKVTYTPTNGHTNIYYTVEEWYPDVPASERNADVKFLTAALQLPGTGNAKIDLTNNGLNQTANTTAYFTSPTVETTTDALVAASGLLMVNGSAVATVTDLNMTIDGKGKPADGVVGTDVRPDIFVGKVMVSGSFTAYFDGTGIPDLFRGETLTSIYSVLSAGSAANADFMALSLYALKLNSSTPDDGETGLKRTYNFVAQLNASGGAGVATEKTTLLVQDSAA